MDWISILGNVASGGVLGLVGTVVTESVGYFKRKQEHAQLVDRMKLEAEIVASKTAGDLAVARENGAADAFTESQRAEMLLRGESKWVTDLRAMTRPGLTWLATLATIGFGLLPPSSETGIVLAMTCSNYAGMMISWWFGQRAIEKSTVSWGNRVSGAKVISG